jgi:hypothetical protein
MNCNQFKKAIEAEFGACEFKATKGEQVITSSGWPTDKKHPANAPDSKYTTLNLDYIPKGKSCEKKK